jgi:DNA phosphorothioation-associated putative methyltransferase
VVGKRVRDALYVHRSAVPLLTAGHRERLERALAEAGDASWNVARVEPEAVGLLLYPDFDEAAFPALVASVRVDLTTGSVTGRSFEGSVNPLILHRKELLVAPDHPHAQDWASLTASLEALGLFRRSHLIGRRAAWVKRLAEAGVRVEGHALCPT